MTTIQLSKSGVGTIEIQGAKIEEVFTKEVISYAKPFTKTKWGTMTPTQPVRIAIDILKVNRVFTITGTIDKESISGGTSAPQARDVLINMGRYGGALTFKYGVASDVYGKKPDGTNVSYYSPSINNMYYDSNGFSCHVNRIQVSEEPKGGASADETPSQFGEYGTPHKLPEQYSVTVELVHAIDN